MGFKRHIKEFAQKRSKWQEEASKNFRALLPHTALYIVISGI